MELRCFDSRAVSSCIPSIQHLSTNFEQEIFYFRKRVNLNDDYENWSRADSPLYGDNCM